MPGSAVNAQAATHGHNFGAGNALKLTMENILEITIWDLDPVRIADIRHNLALAFQDVGIRANIIVMSEPPLISRMQLLHRIPLLEIKGKYWELKRGYPISREACLSLLRQLVWTDLGDDHAL